MLLKMQFFSFNDIDFKKSSAKCQPFSGLCDYIITCIGWNYYATGNHFQDIIIFVLSLAMF